MVSAKDLRDAEIGDFQVAFVVHEQVLELNISMRDAVRMQVGHASQELFEETQVVVESQVVLLHQCVNLPLRAKLHDMIPSPAMRAQSDALDNVGVMQTFGNHVLRMHLLVVLLFSLMLAPFPKLFDGEHAVCYGCALLNHKLHGGRRALADQFPPPSRHYTRARILVVQLDGFDIEIGWEISTESPSFQASAGSGGH